jgi:phenylalanine-4-hydroxylase
MNRPPIEEIPEHLRAYITEQDPALYSAIDQAVWRFVMRLSRTFFLKHAHPIYNKGLDVTSIPTDRIPLVVEMDRALRKLGWRAVAVNGFIPPAIFLEFLSMRVLPIACDIRKLDHLGYTPSPDIIHEAAGHAPMLADAGYRKYLEAYGEVARSAIISKDDLDLYAAIFALSAIKENPQASPFEVDEAQRYFDQVASSITEVSEVAYLTRMAWWTTEYGLIGSMESPLIYGSGLLSSVRESFHCLSDRVKKVPFSLKCIETSYDITRPQPQLFVAQSFEQLTEALEEFSATMAYRIGGVEALKRGVSAKNTVTVVTDTGVQFSGMLVGYEVCPDGAIESLHINGDKQISSNDKTTDEVPHYKLSEELYLPFFERGVLATSFEGLRSRLHTTGLMARGGVRIFGNIVQEVSLGGRGKVLVLENARAEKDGVKIKGVDPVYYPLVLSSDVRSVFGGAADRVEFLSRSGSKVERTSKVPVHRANLSVEQNILAELYQKVRDFRDSGKTAGYELTEVYNALRRRYPKDWLLRLELLEIVSKWPTSPEWMDAIRVELKELASQNQDHGEMIDRGLALIR